MVSFNGIPLTIRTPGFYTEIDNSQAIQGLVAEKKKCLMFGQMLSGGSATADVPALVGSGDEADALFGAGSMLAQMVRKFKTANIDTELWVAPQADSTTAAAGDFQFTGPATANGSVSFMIGGYHFRVAIASGDAATAIATAVAAAINANSQCPVTAAASIGDVDITCRFKGTLGDDIDHRMNYYSGEELPAGVGVTLTAMTGGAGDPTLTAAITAIGDEKYHYFITPYWETVAVGALEVELARRFGPMVQAEGSAFYSHSNTAANLTTYGNARNSPHGSCMGSYDSPTPSYEWAAVYGAVGAFNGSIDPARPFQTLELPGILPPAEGSTGRFSRSQRDVLLWDGIATYKVNTSGNVAIERAITTYQTNVSGVADPSYLDVNTLLTLAEIRFQYRTRMALRYPRHKLVSDSTRVGAGSATVRPKDLRQEIIALFRSLETAGLIENLDEFKSALIVIRDIDDGGADPNRVNVKCNPDLVNQFRILATQMAFIL